MANKKESRMFCGTGRRKSSVARVILRPGKGKITVNGRDVNEYMPFPVLVMDLKQPLELTNNALTFDVDCNVTGGGFSGQTGAIRLGITRALLEYDKENEGKEACASMNPLWIFFPLTNLGCSPPFWDRMERMRSSCCSFSP